MGADDNLNASLAHLVLTLTAGRGCSQMQHGYTHPGMHANFFVHGVVGFLHFQSGAFNTDFSAAYRITHLASRYLALPCLMADLWKGENQALSAVHLLSGVLPFMIAVTQKDNSGLGHLCLTCNVISLIFYSFERNREWGWYTAGCALLAYFMIGQTNQVKIMYPLGLALMEYCTYRLTEGASAPAGPPRR